MGMSWTEWWMFAALTLSAFVGCLVLNFIVKIINDARLEDRYLRIRQKASTNQGTQVHSPLAEITARTPRVIPLDNMLQKHNATPNRISLVFNKEHNLLENKRLADIIDSDEEISSVKIISNPTSGSRSCESIAKPMLLGNIYNKNKSDNEQRLSTKTDDNISVDMDNAECKSVINLKNQNYQDLKELLSGLVTNITNDDRK